LIIRIIREDSLFPAFSNTNKKSGFKAITHNTKGKFPTVASLPFAILSAMLCQKSEGFCRALASFDS
jgi:hypothetical protein